MDSRQRMIETTLQLLRTQGLRATGMNQIVAESRAPRGSIYHHFPGGKEQLAIESLRTAGEIVAAKIEHALDSQASVARAVEVYSELYGEEIRQSDFARGCPVGNAAMDASATSPAIREVCDAIFVRWASLIAERLEREGVSKSEAHSLAEFVLASIEGALILCRARRSIQPLESVAARLGAMLRTLKRSPAKRKRR